MFQYEDDFQENDDYNKKNWVIFFSFLMDLKTWYMLLGDIINFIPVGEKLESKSKLLKIYPKQTLILFSLIFTYIMIHKHVSYLFM